MNGPQLEVIMFDDGTYGIRNTWTDKVLSEHGVIITRRTEAGARRKANKIAKRLNKVINSLNKNHKI